MAATLDKGINNKEAKMSILLATEKTVLGPVQGKTAKRIIKR